ncbi:MAG: ATP-binding protein [Candidatus Schekmanbacteria bacterium]|nr:ATP-binding protein [Candidatus Schekmanbacteria bacterium]
MVGDTAFVDGNASDNCYGYVVTGARPRSIGRGRVVELRKTLRVPARFSASRFPRVVVLPSDNRDLVVPRVKYKAPGKLEDDTGFVAWWERPGEQQWGGSTVELLFSARWSDLNAKEEGRPKDAVQFDRFTRAFADLTRGRKRLTWTAKGDLVVEIDDGTTHAVDALSAGERQAVLLLAELRRLWRPGSLVLIDELELHLHDAWQGKLYENVLAMQRELGGQVVITTQSHSLFEMAESGTQALLGRGALR